MPKAKGGLGRGLNSLFPSETQEQPEAPSTAQPAAPESTPGAPPVLEASQAGLMMVPVSNISPNPHQPRGSFNEENLEELTASIREHGVLQPLVVTQSDKIGQSSRYNLIAGERRWRAAMLAGLDEVPVVVKEASSREMLELALVENLQRADLNPVEEATAYRSLVDDFGMKQDEVADRVGKSRTSVNNSLRLLRLPPPILEALAAGTLSEGHARALLQIPEVEAQLIIAERIASQGLSVRQVEALARRLAESVEAPEEAEESQDGQSDDLYDPIRDLEEQFRTALGTKVQLSRSRRGGRLVIYFYSDEELDRIYGTIIRDENNG